jgi:hypothetical protein
MQQFACVDNPVDEAVYMLLHGFTAVDLGYQQGEAVSSIVNKAADSIVLLPKPNEIDSEE